MAEPYGSANPEVLRCTAHFTEPFGIGLEVRAGTTPGIGPEAFVSPGFDAALHVEADGILAAQRVLRGRAGDLLLALELEGKKPRLDDREVRIVIPASVAEAPSTIDRLVHVVEAAEAARTALPGKVDPRARALGVLASIAARTGGYVDDVVAQVARPGLVEECLLGERVEASPAR